MAKAKAKTELNEQDKEFLAARKAKKAADQKAFPKMKQLAINTDAVDADGNRIQPGTFYVRGEKTYSEVIQFVPIEVYTYYKRTIPDGKGSFKTVAETILAKNFETPYDNLGGIACGRVLGKAVPDSWTETQKKENRDKASWYIFLFGQVIFPNGETHNVNFRVPKAKAKIIMDTLKEVDRSEELFDHILELKLIPVKGKPHPTLEADIGPVDHDSYGEIIKAEAEIAEYVEAHNKRITSSRDRIKQARANANLVESVTGSDDDLETDFDDEETE